METAYQSQPLATVVNENRKALFSFIGVFLSQQNLSRRKSRKNAYFSSQICTFASSKSERSLAIQNNVPQCTPLISKSLPIHLSLKGNTLLLNKIVRKRKIPKDLSDLSSGFLSIKSEGFIVSSPSARYFRVGGLHGASIRYFERGVPHSLRGGCGETYPPDGILRLGICHLPSAEPNRGLVWQDCS